MISDMSLTSTSTGTTSDTSISGSSIDQGQGLGIGQEIAQEQGPGGSNKEDIFSCDDDIQENVLDFPSLSPPLPPIDSFTISDVRSALMECCEKTDAYLQVKYQPYPNRYAYDTPIKILIVIILTCLQHSLNTPIVLLMNRHIDYPS